MPVAETALALQKPAAAETYISRRENLRLVKLAKRTQRDSEGNSVDEKPGQTIVFRDGRLVLPLSGKVTLEDGRACSTSEVREFLHNHPMYGDVEEGFWLMPSITPPPSPDEVGALLQLAEAKDADGLRAFIAEEEGGFARAELLTAARASLERIEPAEK